VPIYEYGCRDCGNITSVLVRSVGGRTRKPVCAKCGAKSVERIISRFAFHQSLQSKLEQLDPKYDKMIDASNPDLSFGNLVKKYKLDEPITKPAKD
jgi:putative FmdB family regulatory protein